MVKTSKRLLVLGLLALSFNAYADGPYTRSVTRSSSSSSGSVNTTNIVVNPNTASNTQVFYASGTTMDGAQGLAYDRIQNRVTVGTPDGAAIVFGDTLRVSGTTTLTGLLTASSISATAVSSTGVSATQFAGPLSATPVYSFNGNLTTGVGQQIANTVDLTTSGSPRVRVQTTQVGIAPNVIIGATIATPSATLHVSGTAIATVVSVTNYVNVGSPTTAPTCNAVNKGNIFMNTTTNCLNYCNGTSNIQVTSSAGTCT